MTTTVQLRIDSDTKIKAQKILEKLGLDLSSGIKMFLTQVINSSSIPFTPRTANGYTLKREKEILKEAQWTKKHGKKYASARAMLDDMLG